MAETAEMDRVEAILWAVKTEVQETMAAKGPFNSVEDGWDRLGDDANELWLEVDKEPHRRDLRQMQLKAVRVAATAVRFILNAQ